MNVWFITLYQLYFKLFLKFRELSKVILGGGLRTEQRPSFGIWIFRHSSLPSTSELILLFLSEVPGRTEGASLCGLLANDLFLFMCFVKRTAVLEIITSLCLKEEWGSDWAPSDGSSFLPFFKKDHPFPTNFPPQPMCFPNHGTIASAGNQI